MEAKSDWKRLLSIVGVAAIAIGGPALADPSSTAVRDAIVKSKALRAELGVSVRVAGSEVTVSTYRHPGASEDDCKIDAVLVAKAVIDSDPANFSRVKVVFVDRSDSSRSRQAIVTAGDVKAFGAGGTSRDQLLASISLTAVPTGWSRNMSFSQRVRLGAVPGPLRGERRSLLGLIERIRSRGYHVALQEKMFARIENSVLAKGSEDSIKQQLSDLRDQLNAIVTAINQGKSLPGNLATKRPAKRPSRPVQPSIDSYLAGEITNNLGKDFLPRQGFAFQDRCRILERILELKRNGRDVSGHLRNYRRLEALALRGNSNAFRLQRKVTMMSLGMPTVPLEE